MTAGLVAVTALVVTLVFTSLAEQLSTLSANSRPSARGIQQLPAQYPALKRVVGEIFALPSSPS